MTIVHETSVFNVDEAAIYKLLTDPVGGSPTYGAKQLCPLIQNVGCNPDMLNKELYGDGSVKARAAKLRQLMAVVTYGMLNFDVLAILNGSTVTDAGTTPNQTSTLDITTNDIPNYFKLEFRILQTDLPGGSLSVALHKCKVSDFVTGFANKEDFAPQSFSLAAIPLRSNGKIASPVLHETAAALSA
jgi:hypothetical protein